MKIKIMFFIMYVFSNLIFADVNLRLKLEDKVDYEDMGEAYGFSMSQHNFIDQKSFSYFSWMTNSQYIFDLETLSCMTFGEKGNGPGNFQMPSFKVLIDKKFFSIDKKKMSILKTDSNFNFIQEKKLNCKPISIFNYEGKIGVIAQPFEEGDYLIYIYDCNLEFIKKECLMMRELNEYTDQKDVIRLYSDIIYSKKIKDEIWIFFGTIPSVLIYDCNNKKRKLVSFKDGLSFKPGELINIGHNSISLFHQLLSGENSTSFFYQGMSGDKSNLKQKNPQPKCYFYLVNKENYDVSMISLQGLEKKISIQSKIIIRYNKLFVFDDNEEILYKYSIQQNY